MSLHTQETWKQKQEHSKQLQCNPPSKQNLTPAISKSETIRLFSSRDLQSVAKAAPGNEQTTALGGLRSCLPSQTIEAPHKVL